MVFSNFFHSQMLFHAKALELYTTAFQSLGSLNEEQDIEVLLITNRSLVSGRKNIYGLVGNL